MNDIDVINMIDKLRERLIERARTANGKSQNKTYSEDLAAFMRGMRDGYSQSAQLADECLSMISPSTGFQVFLSTDDGANWKLVAWFAEKPDHEIMWRLDKLEYREETYRFFDITEKQEYEIEGGLGQRKYRILPVTSQPESEAN